MLLLFDFLWWDAFAPDAQASFKFSRPLERGIAAGSWKNLLSPLLLEGRGGLGLLNLFRFGVSAGVDMMFYALELKCGSGSQGQALVGYHDYVYCTSWPLISRKPAVGAIRYSYLSIAHAEPPAMVSDSSLTLCR